MVKTEKFYNLGPKTCPPPPILGMQNPSNPRLWQTVRVTSKLLMYPTNVIASDPQVCLLALIWCKKLAFFDILLFIGKFLKLFFYDILDDQ